MRGAETPRAGWDRQDEVGQESNRGHPGPAPAPPPPGSRTQDPRALTPAAPGAGRSSPGSRTGCGPSGSAPPLRSRPVPGAEGGRRPPRGSRAAGAALRAGCSGRRGTATRASSSRWPRPQPRLQAPPAPRTGRRRAVCTQASCGGEAPSFPQALARGRTPQLPRRRGGAPAPRGPLPRAQTRTWGPGARGSATGPHLAEPSCRCAPSPSPASSSSIASRRARSEVPGASSLWVRLRVRSAPSPPACRPFQTPNPPEEGHLSAVHAGPELQSRVVSEGRHDEAEQQRQAHEEGGQHDLRDRPVSHPAALQAAGPLPAPALEPPGAPRGAP